MAITFCFLATVAFSSNVSAHEIRPSIADFNLVGEDRFEIVIKTNVEAMLAGIGSEHEDTDQAASADAYNALRQLPPDQLKARFEDFEGRLLQELEVKFDGNRAVIGYGSIEVPDVGDLALARDSSIRLTGTIPQGAKTLEWLWPQAFGASVIRLNSTNPSEQEGYSAYLSAGEASEPIALENMVAKGFWQVVSEYIVIGFTHILPKGLDHILFVVGLFLLSTKLSPLLWQITAFTVAHTVSLALGILGYVNISPSIVEPLIAASIVYVAVENILTDKLQRWRPLVVFGFGLLHGLGFAGVLREIGMSQTHFVTSLISFNIGVELGQLTVIALCFLAVGYWFGKKNWYRDLITTPASLAIAIIASWWVYERVFLT